MPFWVMSCQIVRADRNRNHRRPSRGQLLGFWREGVAINAKAAHEDRREEVEEGDPEEPDITLDAPVYPTV